MRTFDLAQFHGKRARILAVKLSSFGDIIHSTAALRALRAALPDAEIVVAVERRWADVLRHNPHIDGIIESSTQDRVSPRYLQEIRTSLAKRRFDAAIDFQGNRRSAAWAYLSGAKWKLGRGGFRPGWQFSMQPDPSHHAVEVCASICHGIGVPVAKPDPEIFTNPADELGLDEVLRSAAMPLSGFLLLNPFSRWTSKSWPLEHLVPFVRGLAQCCEHPLVLTGGAEDRTRAQELLAEVPRGRVSSLAGRLPLAQALCLFRRARLMVSCDSGPMHAAAAFGVPVIALFGPTFPERTGPWGEQHRVLQALRPPVHSTYRTDIEGRYMLALKSEMVLSEVISHLSPESMAAQKGAV